MPRNLKIKKGDVVRVIAGKDKGAEGKVIAVQSEQDRVIVEGINRIKRHTKVVNQGGRAGTTGGIITQEAAIHVSNVMLLVDAPKGDKTEKAEKAEKAAKDDDKAEKKGDKAEKSEKGEKSRGKVTTRIGYRRDEVTKRRPDGSTYSAHRSTRIARKSGEEI
jgi:large subunit ribosomal protein L24